jgi:hypothetical protein
MKVVVKLKITFEMVATAATYDNIKEIWFLICTNISERVQFWKIHINAKSVPLIGRYAV